MGLIGSNIWKIWSLHHCNKRSSGFVSLSEITGCQRFDTKSYAATGSFNSGYQYDAIDIHRMTVIGLLLMTVIFDLQCCSLRIYEFVKMGLKF